MGLLLCFFNRPVRRTLGSTRVALLLCSGIKMIQDIGRVESLNSARADYSGGSLNSLNGANLVESHERAVYCVLPHILPRTKAHVNKEVHHVHIVTEKKKNGITCFKIPFIASRQSIIHKQCPTETVTKDLMWFRNTSTHFHSNMHLTFDPLKHLA